MKSPTFSGNLINATAGSDYFLSQAELNGLRFEGVHLAGIKADYLNLKQVQLQGVYLNESHLYASSFADVWMGACSLANTHVERLLAHRVEFIDCLLLGLNATDAHFQDVCFRACDGRLAGFRFSTFKSVIFERCNLRRANFQGADLTGVRFIECDLSEAEMSQTTLKGTDFRTSTIDAMRIGAEEVVGAIVDHFQAAYMASLLGLVIKSEDEG